MKSFLDNQQEKNFNKEKLFYIVAGESSGDILGAGLIKELKQKYPNAKFHGIGGALMLQQGLKPFYPMERLSVMGVVPILMRFVELLAMRRRLRKKIIADQADCFIGIDAPVFNTQLEYDLKKKGIKTVHYVSPSVWAWRANRIYKIVKSVSLMICLFPFELDIYKKHRLPAVCVGHPLADEIPLTSENNIAREKLDLSRDEKLLAILPGSRGSEMKFLLEPFIQTAQNLSDKFPELTFIIPCANQKRREQIEKYFTENNISLTIKLVDGNSRLVMQAADFVLLASGTATLEAMLLKKPMVVAYRVSAFSYWVYDKFLKVRNFALPNLLAKKKIVKEVMQENCTVENLTKEVEFLIDGEAKQQVIEEYNVLHQELRQGGNEKAAKAIVDLLDMTESESLAHE